METLGKVRELKKKYSDSIILIRVGMYYVSYNIDADICSKTLGINRIVDTDGATGERFISASFPHHALDTYLPKLIRAGHRVAICDQL